MNKTVTINISGIIFHIEEDAYESLSRYLSTIKSYFSKTDGGSEIMADIEARIAELLQEKTSASKQVVLMGDVEQVMLVMGRPEDFGAEPGKEEKEAEEQFQHPGEKIKRRLFRNPDEKAIGGVCSGLAAYFDIDTVWVRLAMFLLIFFGGLSLWVYIVMWIIIPQAKTTADKFAMRGKSANINNILKSFKEEAEDVKNRVNKYGKEVRDADYGNSIRSSISKVLGVFFNIISRLIGLFLLFIGAIFLFAYVTSLFGISVINSNTDIGKWKSVIFESSTDYTLSVIAFIIVAGIPVFMFIYAGIKLLFRIHYSNRRLNLSLGILWLIGLIIGFYTAVNTVKQFNENARIKQAFELHGVGDTLVVKTNPAVAGLKSMQLDNEDDLETFLSTYSSDYTFGESGRQLSVISRVSLDVVEGTSDSVELVINQTARGNSKREASESAKAIQYNYTQNKNELMLDEIFHVMPGSKFRAQDLDVKIKLPKGKVVYFDKSLKYMLDDADNTTNTSPSEMIDRRWKMTDRGLECIDCAGLDENESNTDDIIINGKGINVNNDEAHIKIDEHGIKIKTKNHHKKTEDSNEAEERNK